MRRLPIVVGSLFILIVLVIAVGSWFGSSALINPHHDLVKRNVNVVSIFPSQVVLARTAESARPGVYGLDFRSGHAIVGTVFGTTSSTVTRQLRSTTGRLAPGTKVGIDAVVWTGDPQTALGIPYRAITFPDPLGPMPAWLAAGRGSTWVIFVHGIDGTRAGGLRPLGELHRLGLPTLLIAYRNDPGAPRSPDGHIHLGMTEWQDLDAAARWAVARGAQHLVLYGDSMGGSIVTRFMHLSRLAARVSALVLDAPVLDWRGVIDHVASRLHLPFVGPPVRWMIELRIAVDWDALDELAQAGTFRLPILLFQGLDDPLVPPADSRRFAQTAPGPVTYVPVPGAAHIESWNADPANYDARLRQFLGRL
ncbi:MAG TPA: hypothetical protein VGY32_05755 [Solirubrobacteraceae bacterium]|nr:hypothetical protein [Solirubrobacteraceae bacterium]